MNKFVRELLDRALDRAQTAGRAAAENFLLLDKEAKDAKEHWSNLVDEIEGLKEALLE